MKDREVQLEKATEVLQSFRLCDHQLSRRQAQTIPAGLCEHATDILKEDYLRSSHPHHGDGIVQGGCLLVVDPPETRAGNRLLG